LKGDGAAGGTRARALIPVESASLRREGGLDLIWSKRHPTDTDPRRVEHGVCHGCSNGTHRRLTRTEWLDIGPLISTTSIFAGVSVMSRIGYVNQSTLVTDFSSKWT